MPIIVFYFRKKNLITNFSVPTRQSTTSKILMYVVIKKEGIASQKIFRLISVSLHYV